MLSFECCSSTMVSTLNSKFLRLPRPVCSHWIARKAATGLRIPTKPVSGCHPDRRRDQAPRTPGIVRIRFPTCRKTRGRSDFPFGKTKDTFTCFKREEVFRKIAVRPAGQELLETSKGPACQEAPEVQIRQPPVLAKRRNGYANNVALDFGAALN